MACGGCGGSSSGAASGPVWSGSLSGGAADASYSLSGGAPDAGIAAADIAGGSLSSDLTLIKSGGFWLLLVFVVGAAWYWDSKKREGQ